MRKKIISIVLMLTMVFLFSTVALADAEGPRKNTTLDGRYYTYFASVKPSSLGPRARVTITTTSNVTTDGLMGAFAKLYNASGTMVAGSSWRYSKIGDGKTFYAETVSYLTAGTFYAAGDVQAWDATHARYQQYYCDRSPNYSYNLRSLLTESLLDSALQVEYMVNDAGETYGSGLFAGVIGEEPDLVAALGVNGVEGYVKTSDINQYKANTLDEAAIINFATAAPISIPVYASDGITVIDTFIMNAE